MLSRWLTLGLALLVGTLSGCENQGYAVGNASIEQICAYNREAIRQLDCKDRTLQGTGGATGTGGTTGNGDSGGSSSASSSTATAISRVEENYLVCVQQHTRVASRCSSQQKILADCMFARYNPLVDSVARTAKFTEDFTCTTNDSGKENGNAKANTGLFCVTEMTELESCVVAPPKYAP